MGWDGFREFPGIHGVDEVVPWGRIVFCISGRIEEVFSRDQVDRLSWNVCFRAVVLQFAEVCGAITNVISEDVTGVQDETVLNGREAWVSGSGVCW